MRRLLIAASIAMLAAVAGAPPAAAKTRVCVAGEYGGYDVASFPAVYRLRATLPRRTDGVASPCEVADTIAGLIQEGFEDEQRFPSGLRPTGEDWDAGSWSCVYQNREGNDVPYMVAKCHQNGKKFRRVTMDLAS